MSAALQSRASYTREELAALAERGGLPRALLMPFHEVRLARWDEASGTGRIEAVRRNRFDDWFYACHFLGDPVMPGCWGLDGVWQALRLFAAWRGLSGCDKPLGMDGVSFFGQIRPYDREVVFAVDVLSIERDGEDALITGKATVSVDGVPVYTIDSAQVGSAFWEGDGAAEPALPAALDVPLRAPLTWDEFTHRAAFSAPEVIALSGGTLVSNPPEEMPLLPDSLMLEVTDVRRIASDFATGEGEVLATRSNGPGEWFFPMNAGTKPAALLVDGVWQLMGVYHAWAGSAGTGRALGFERVEFFGAVTPADARLVYRLRVLKTVRAPNGDVFVRADAEVFADGRKVLACTNANVGCHKNIRYADYPLASEMGFGGKLKIKE
jgi:3-hydroxyacyl-[acyl-carrier protein] dehydratase/trans-2-decenoyl-[acyl-carrier protein] isomerase